MIIALAAVAVTAWTSSDSMAQDVNQGYGFGVGLGYGSQFSGNRIQFGNGTHFGRYNGRFRGNRRNQGFVGPGYGFGGAFDLIDRVPAPPYFAQFPPVYYNGIVSRPYGVSPYAAPPGILPVEMGVPVAPPQAIHNPYYDQEVAPVSDKPASDNKTENTTDNKTTHIVNPYQESLTKN